MRPSRETQGKHKVLVPPTTNRPQERLSKLLRCTKCGTVDEVLRLATRDKPKGHIKTMECFVCGKLTDHIEL